MAPDEFVARSVAVPQSHLVRFPGAYIPEFEDWIRSIQTDHIFTGANAWDGYMSLLVTDACIASLQKGTPVTIETQDKPDLYK